MDYRARLRAVRKDRDLTQKQIGEVLQKSQQGYNHIEDGRAELRIDDLIRLCRFYNLSADYLIGLTDIENLWNKDRTDCRSFSFVTRDAGIFPLRFTSL